MTRLSNWKEESDLYEVVTGKMTDEKALKKVAEKKGIKNKVVINPKLTEAIKELGGELIEATEEEENGGPLDSKKEADKKSEEQKKKQIEQKQKRAQMIKKQVLMKKLIAVRQGSEDIVASHKPEGKVIAENALEKRAKENEKARKWLKKDAKDSGYTDIALKASMSKGAGVSEDKAFNFVVNKLKAKYGDGVLTKGDKMPELSAAQKKKNAEIRAKRAKEDHRDPTEKASDGRYSDRYSNRGSD